MQLSNESSEKMSWHFAQDKWNRIQSHNLIVNPWYKSCIREPEITQLYNYTIYTDRQKILTSLKFWFEWL